MEFVYFILLGAVAGWLAGVIMKGRGFGILGNIIVGILGALVGGFIAGLMDITAGNLLGQLLIAVGGAIVLLVAIGFVKK